MQTFRTYAIAVGLVVALTGCAAESESSSGSEPTDDPALSSTDGELAETTDRPETATTSTGSEPVRPTAATDELRRIETADGDRQYFLHTPPGDGSALRPLVVVLHGHGGSSRQVRGAEIGRSPMSVWFAIAEREQLVLAFPDGAVGSDDAQGWNDCRRDARANPDTDDVEFLADVIEDTADVVGIDRSKVFTVGISNGGFMSMRMAVERPDLVTGAAAIVASMASTSECDAPTEAVSVLLMNGTADPLLPYEGGQVPFRRGGAMATAEAIELWRALADAQPVEGSEPSPDLDPDDGSTVTRTRWSGAADVWLYTIDGGGHTEPSVAEQYSSIWTDIVGPQNHDIEAAEEVWSFFAATAS